MGFYKPVLLAGMAKILLLRLMGYYWLFTA